MTSSTITRPVGQQSQTRSIKPSWKRGTMVVAAVGLLAALGFSALTVLGDDGPSIRTIPATVVGDRDAAFISAAERYQAYLANKEAASTQAGQSSVAPPATDRDEAFRQSMERQQQLKAGQATDKEEGLRQAELRRQAQQGS